MNFSQRFLNWAARAGFSVTLGGSSYLAMLFDQGGETRYYIRESRESLGWLTISIAQRAGDDYFELAAASWAVIERYFTGSFGPEIRSSEKLPRLRTPRKRSQLKAGYEIVGPINGHAHLVDPAGEHIVTTLDDPTDIATLVMMSHWLSASLTDLETSFLDPVACHYSHSRARGFGVLAE